VNHGIAKPGTPVWRKQTVVQAPRAGPRLPSAWRNQTLSEAASGEALQRGPPHEATDPRAPQERNQHRGRPPGLWQQNPPEGVPAALGMIGSDPAISRMLNAFGRGSGGGSLGAFH